MRALEFQFYARPNLQSQEENMELKNDVLTAAQRGEHVKIQAEGHTFYLLSREAYDEFGKVDYDAMSTEEMNLLADEACAIISESEADGY